MLEQDHMTIADLKQKLLEYAAPDQVMGYEVRDRVAVGDKEVDAYYAAHPGDAEVPAVASFREIVLVADAGKKAARRAEAASRPADARRQPGEEDPDIAGIRPGPQPPTE